MSEKNEHEELRENTAPGAPASAAQAKTSKKASSGVFTSFLARLSKPLVAVVIILGIIGVGYYGYVKSSADTVAQQVFSFDRSAVPCKANATAAQCKEKRDNQEAAALKDFVQSCNTLDRVYNSNNQACRVCKAGYLENENNVCKLRKEVNCDAQNRKQDTKYDCGGCKSGYAEGPGGNCRQKVDCDAQNRVQTDPLNCGACKTGFAEGSGGNCRKKDTPAPTGTPATPTPVSVKPTCDAKHVEYDKAKNKCTDTCLAGYALKNRICAPAPAASVQAACTAAHKQYDATKNVCLSTCVAGYVLVGSDCQVRKPQVDAVVKATCDKAFTNYDVTTNKCLKTCVTDYYRKDNKCVKIPNKVADCNKDINGRCSADVEAVKAICKGQHREYNSKKNICRTSCIDGYYLADGVCAKTGPGEPKAVKAACDKQNLSYNSDANICRPGCKAGYTLRDSKCIAWDEASMTQYRCSALGRVWVKATLAEDKTVVTEASCSTVCTDTVNTVYTDLNDADNSYCKTKAKAAVGTPGISLGMTKEECKKLHRVWVGALEGCTAKCKAGYYPVDGICKEITVAATPIEQGSGSEGGEDDGCKSDLQRVPVRGPNGKVTIVSVCPDDEPATPPTTTDGGKTTKHEVETDLTKSACKLLGRAWVPSAKDKDGKTILGGCSLQECATKGVEIRKASNSAYCEGFVNRISKEKCVKSHRIWSPIVQACMSRSDQDRTKPVVDAPQCNDPYSVYIYHTAAQGMDECVKPTTYESLKKVAKQSGKPVAYVASLPGSGICKLRPGMVWVDGKCVKKRVPAPHTSNNGGGATSGGSDSNTGTPTGDGMIDCGVMGKVRGTSCPYLSQSGCAAKHRAWSGGTCQTSCAKGWTGYTTASPYNYCSKKAEAPSTPTVNCPGNMYEINGECYGHGGGGATPSVTIKNVTCDELKHILAEHDQDWYLCPFTYMGDWGCKNEVTKSDDTLITRTYTYGYTKYVAKTC